MDDTELIDVLAATKATAEEAIRKLAIASSTRAKITEACEEYRPVATRAALLYFLISSFSSINCMYQVTQYVDLICVISTLTGYPMANLAKFFMQTSLKQFSQLYASSIEQSPQNTITSRRVLNIIIHLTTAVSLFVSRGLFQSHRLVFALALANEVALSTQKARLLSKRYIDNSCM